jgi:hypothetical protein
MLPNSRRQIEKGLLKRAPGGSLMSKNTIIGVLLLITGVLIGVKPPALSAQQREGRRGLAPLPTLDQLPQEVATLQLIPTNSTIMMDVQWHWTNLWWAGKKRNWNVAQYYFNESRGHSQQLVRKNPTIRNQVDARTGAAGHFRWN